MEKFKITVRIRTLGGKRKSITRVVYSESYSSAKNLFWEKVKIPRRYFVYGRLTCVHYVSDVNKLKNE
jgi:hypothetical protein